MTFLGSKSILLVVLLITCFLPDMALSENTSSVGTSVGVQAGDWIEYNVTTTGNPPEEHNVTWARLEILHVQGAEVYVNVTTLARNGSISSLLMTLNIDKGVIGAWWIIAPNLNPGQTFYDSFLNTVVTIKGEERLNYCGATRTIINATVPTRVKQWDKTTGVFVLSDDVLPDYTIHVVAYATNMWSPDILGLDPALFYVVMLIVIVAVVIVAVALVAWSKKRNDAAQ